MPQSINLATLLTVAGGLGAAMLPATARANCNPSSGSSAISAAPIGNFGGPQFNPEAEYQIGLKAFEAGDFRKARSTFATLLPYAPKDGSIHYLLGASRIGLGDYKGAIKPLEKAIKYAPDMMIAHRDLGVAYARTGNTEQARVMLARLQADAAACNGTCEAVEPLKTAIGVVEAAMAA